MGDTNSNPFSSIPDPLAGQASGQQATLSNWVAPYVTSVLGRADALSNMPYTPYTGPLTAGPSQLQQQAFDGIAGLAVPDDIGQAANAMGQLADRAQGMSFDPNTFTSGVWDSDTAQQYMNPYLTGALEPQIEEARRQAEIQRMQNAARLTNAGAFGGSRQAIMEAEGDRNLLRNLADITGQGYSDAFTQARSAFESDQDRMLRADQATEQSRQFGSTYGLDALRQAITARESQGRFSTDMLNAESRLWNDVLRAGNTQRDIMSEGIRADRDQFEEERDFPFTNLQYLHSLLQGMPVGASNTSYVGPSNMSTLAGVTGGLLDLYNEIFR